MRRAFGSRRLLVRDIVVWIVSALALRILDALLPAVDVGGWRSALAAAAPIGIFSAILWPLFVRFTPRRRPPPQFPANRFCGSRGGMGGTQMFPFGLVPSDVSLLDEHVVDQGSVHRWLRRWLSELGHDGYGEQRA
jgi:hypothetical protein